MESKLVIPTANHAAELAEAIRVLDTHSYAYVTFLAGDGDYVKGVICLAKGLRKVKALFPLVVAVLPDVPSKHRDMLKKARVPSSWHWASFTACRGCRSAIY